MRYTAEFCDREYNARAMIPDHPAIFARWARVAQDVRAHAHARLDLAYGSSPKQSLDFFPAAHADAPLFVFVHGGYWRSLDKSDFSWIAPPFVERGVAVAMLNYDLLPAVSVHTIVLQVLRALEWLWRESETLGFDPSRIVVGGHSAGGHLAAMSACALWPQWDPDLPADLVAGVVSVSGLYDLEPLRHTTFLGPDLALDEAGAFRASPAWMTPATGAPVVTAAGGLESESFKAQSALLAQRWPRNVVADLPMPGRNHLTVVDALAEPGNPLFEAALGLCRGA